MTLHQALDAAVAHAEEARETLNAAYALTPAEELWEKDIYLDGELVERSRISLETAVKLMRGPRGAGVCLVGAAEVQGENRLRVRAFIGSRAS
ncbi:MAG: hypothetical protein M3498_08325 [Deinococcota bacterium]|nr:hypothetical protein [Deinococcota bacterium]